MDFLDYWNGTKGFLALKARKADKKPIFTTQSEAERRAAICVGCPKHVDAEHAAIQEKGWLEQWTTGVMRKQIQGRTTSQDATLGKCSVCKCETRTIVHIHREIMALGVEAKDHPSNCWKHNMR